MPGSWYSGSSGSRNAAKITPRPAASEEDDATTSVIRARAHARAMAVSATSPTSTRPTVDATTSPSRTDTTG